MANCDESGAPPIAELPVTKASAREHMTPGFAARHFVPHLPSGSAARSTITVTEVMRIVT